MIGFVVPRYVELHGRGVAAFEVEDPQGGQYAYRARSVDDMEALFARHAPACYVLCGGGGGWWPSVPGGFRDWVAAQVARLDASEWCRRFGAAVWLDAASVGGRHVCVMLRASAAVEPLAGCTAFDRDPLHVALPTPLYKPRRQRRRERRGASRAADLRHCYGVRAAASQLHRAVRAAWAVPS